MPPPPGAVDDKLESLESVLADIKGMAAAEEQMMVRPASMDEDIPDPTRDPQPDISMDEDIPEPTRDAAPPVVPIMQPQAAAPPITTSKMVPVVEMPAPLRRTTERPDMAKMIRESSDLLSHQAIMENFVHHNPWESLQHMEFFDALDDVAAKSEYMSPAERMSTLAPMDPRTRANKAMADLGAPYLDRGLAKWEAPDREHGFIYFFARVEGLGLAGWRKPAVKAAETILQRYQDNPELDPEELAAEILEENLRELEPDTSKWTSTTRAMLLDLPGWAGMFKRMEDSPREAPEMCDRFSCIKIPVRLAEFVAVHSIMHRASMESMAISEGWDREAASLGEFLQLVPARRKGERPLFGMGKEMTTLQNPSGLAYRNQNFEAVERLEREYERVTLKAINRLPTPKVGVNAKPRPNMQFYTCFDEREESFRRYLEAAAFDPTELETFGCAGFFNMAIRYTPANRRPEEILAPEGNSPPYNHRVEERQLTPGYNDRKKVQAELSLAFEKASYSPLGSLAIAGVGLPYTAARLALRAFSPELTVQIEDAVSALSEPSVTDFDMPYNTEEATGRLAQLFKNIGSKTNFARLIIVAGHGSRSINNPFLAAYNCGACCGREGGPNARVFARCANDPEVRAMLASEHDIFIPNDTWFIGGYHDTTSELVELYDLDRIPESHIGDYKRAQAVIDQARAKNAFERCQKFYLADVNTPEQALRHVQLRSRDAAEVRPELGHSTNAAIIVGRRELSQGRFLDRRIFLPQYDPFNDDDEGTNLATVLTPALVVGSGISLEYFFSTIDGGAGTKVPVNVVGNFGIQQGTAGDLLIGLATQMSELHSPQRALYLIDAPVDRVEAVLSRNQVLMDLVRNNWVRFFVRDPYTSKIYFQYNGEYTEVSSVDDAMGDSMSTAATGTTDFVPFTEHAEYCREVTAAESRYTDFAYLIMVASSFLPLAAADGQIMNVDMHQSLITVAATFLGVSNIAFSRRYLHGEFMYSRMVLCSALMTLGFNIVAASPNLDGALLGWTMIGFSSTFLIGGFNDRPTARDNAAYAFGAYQISDAALLIAAAFSSTNPEIVQHLPPNAGAIAAAGLIVAASIKSSQFPLSGLFLRSMEGASPNSALGYAGLSAHAGIVLLAATNPMWYQYDWAHTMVGLTGGLTVFESWAVANVRADRKGGIASSTSATVGMLFIITALGYSDWALVLSFGHACFRMNQVVRSPGIIHDTHKWEAALGLEKIRPEKPFELFWRMGWAFTRLNSDFFRLGDAYTQVDLKQSPIFYYPKFGQGVVTATILAIIAGFHLPQIDEFLAELLVDQPPQAIALLLLNILGSTALVRFLFGNVLDFGRFRQRHR